eukprot:4586297-Amphidinium_carterae.1
MAQNVTAMSPLFAILLVCHCPHCDTAQSCGESTAKRVQNGILSRDRNLERQLAAVVEPRHVFAWMRARTKRQRLVESTKRSEVDRCGKRARGHFQSVCGGGGENSSTFLAVDLTRGCLCVAFC